MKKFKKIREHQIAIERRRIHQDAHDKVYNRLSAMAKRSEIMASEFPKQEEKFKAISNSIRQVVSDLQDIINGDCFADFSSPVFVDKKMKQICKEHYLCYKQEILFEIKHARYHLLEENSNWHLLCIIQECLNNVGKHSNANQIYIKMFEKNYFLHMHIQDNGKNENNIQPSRFHSGQGLRSIKNRVSVLGGDLNMTTCPQKGTSVNVKIPLPRN